MNDLFSEIFGCYYKIMTEIVNNAPLTIDEVLEVIKQNGYEESSFHLLPLLEELPFIEKKEGKYYSLLKNKIKMPVTDIEKRWLKAVMQDPKFKLFAEEYELLECDNIQPSHEQSQFRYYDKYSDGDDFENHYYKKFFRKINNAMNTKTPVKIVYKSPKKGRITSRHYIPLKFEFSPKDDKFRFFAARIQDDMIKEYVCLNMGRILDVRNSRETCSGEIELESHLEIFDCEEPVTVEIYDERNAIERFMIEFSSYKKQSIFNDETKTCTTKVYYRKTDETEILIKLLSFGPMIKVLAPKSFLVKFKYRIARQMELIKK